MLFTAGSPRVMAVAGKVRSISEKAELHICVLYKIDQVNNNINAVRISCFSNLLQHYLSKETDSSRGRDISAFKITFETAFQPVENISQSF